MENEKIISNHELNNFKIFCNNIDYQFQILLEKIKSITNNELILENIANDYRNKIFEISDEFEKHGINFWAMNSIKSDITNKLQEKITEATNIIEKATNRIIKYHKLNLIPGGQLIYRKLLENINLEYTNIQHSIKTYTFTTGIESLIFKRYTSDKYYIYTPGSFIQMYEADKETFKKLGLEEEFEKIDNSLLTIVKQQEIKTKEYKNEYENNKDVLKTK